MDEIKNPPYDGSNPCPMCPVEVRDLLATAHNYLNALRHSEPSRIARKRRELEQSVKRAQAICDKHFADPMHSQGRISR